ncbi:hypothetical protein ACIRL2_45945 [Embleya sp. NPDC127516]|uniref:hypothetical protein n=1 Tax=Embleya sp. NPDC127516 TaxID=3363990 RepID=UPI0038052BAF
MRIAKPGLDAGQVRMRTDLPDATPLDGMLPGTVRIGPVVDITPSVPLTAAEVRFSFEPERDLPNGTGEQPSTLANAYIAIWEGALGLWFPLETRYDGTTHELVATAPHFSLLSARERGRQPLDQGRRDRHPREGHRRHTRQELDPRLRR